MMGRIFEKKVGLKKWKSERVMDGKSAESIAEDEVTSV